MLPMMAVDVVLMDISMPNMGGEEATRKALEIYPDLKIVTLSMFGDENYYTRMVDAGAKGFLLKDSAIDEVFEAIDVVVDGGSYFSDRLLSSLSNRLRSTATSDSEHLSAREIEILLCICRGLSNQEIAEELFISKRTVDAHRANILEKTGCRNTASLVVYAIRKHLVEL
jgi:DNA-binding NarL/FixJ family response regulator